MGNPSQLGAICYEVESSASAWGEDVTTFATHRLPTLTPIDASGLVHEKVAPGRVEQYKSAGSQWVKMAQSGSFSITLDLTGHGSTMVGSPSISAVETFIGAAIGNVALSASASTTLTGGTAAVPTTTASGTFSAGSLCRVGVLGDGDGNGQMYAIGTHSTTSLNLLGELDGAPANGAVLYPVVQFYPPTSPTSGVALTGMRFLLQTANLEYECHGCWLQSYSLSGLNTGGRPQIAMTFGVSWWRYSTATFPSAVSTTTNNPAVVAAGSFNVQDVGTTTRNKRAMRNFELTVTRNVTPLMGPGGVNSAQVVVGARHISDDVELTWTEEADAATTTPVLPGYGTSTTSKHIEYTLSTADGSAVGFKFPKVCITNIATQRQDENINRLTVTAMAYSGDTLTNDLTRAPYVMGWA